jgi:hypothetical protein
MEGSMTPLKMKIGISGSTSTGEGKTYNSIQRGDIVECDEKTAAQYLQFGYAQSDLQSEPGTPYKSEPIPDPHF